MAWERACSPHLRDKASFIPQLTSLLKESKRLVILEEKDESPIFNDIIEFTYSNGHTPGQMLTIIKGKKNKIIFCGDLIPGTSWVHAPITMGYDRYPEKLINEKLELYKKVIPQDWWLFFTHDPKISMSKCTRDDRGKFIPIRPITNLVRFEL